MILTSGLSGCIRRRTDWTFGREFQSDFDLVRNFETNDTKALSGFDVPLSASMQGSRKFAGKDWGHLKRKPQNLVTRRENETLTGAFSL
jgi:hypothetical protein